MNVELRRGEQRIGIGTDGEERDIAKIKQAGVADHDVQAQCKHDEQQRDIDNAHPRTAEQGISHERQRYQRYHRQHDANPCQCRMLLELN